MNLVLAECFHEDLNISFLFLILDLIEVSHWFRSLSPKLECLSYSTFDSLVKFDKMIRFLLPLSLANKQHLEIISENLVGIFKWNSYAFVYFVIFYSVYIFSIHVKISSGDIKIFGSHNVHAFCHFESTCKRLSLVFIISITFVSFIEVT